MINWIIAIILLGGALIVHFHKNWGKGETSDRKNKILTIKERENASFLKKMMHSESFFYGTAVAMIVAAMIASTITFYSNFGHNINIQKYEEIYLLNIYVPFILIYGYFVTFGKDSVFWFFVNSIIGIFQIELIINLIGNLCIHNWDFDKYPTHAHIIPGLYVIIFMFVIRKYLLFLFDTYIKTSDQKYANLTFIFSNLVFYLFNIF